SLLGRSQFPPSQSKYTAYSEISTLSLHDALPISASQQLRIVMRTMPHGNRSDASGIGHIQIISGVANHQSLMRRNTEFSQNLLQHQRMRFGAGFVGAAGGGK